MSVSNAITKESIDEMLQTLVMIKEKKETQMKRKDCITLLHQRLCVYYGYSPFIIEKLHKVFSPHDLVAYVESNEATRPVTIRANTQQTKTKKLMKKLTSRGVVLGKCGEWIDEGIQVFTSPVPIGATPEYLAGDYMVQAAASFLPVLALDPKENEKVLDMCAAPGGKTTHISNMMNNTGIVYANEINPMRQNALCSNLQRMNITNAILTIYDGAEVTKKIGRIDKVLVDAPCSGTGVISKNEEAKDGNDEEGLEKLASTQKRLLSAAIEAVNNPTKETFVVYSTCSVLVEENEEIVDYVLRKYNGVKVVDSSIPFGDKGFTKSREKTFKPEMANARRFYPHKHNTDGFFVAKIRVRGFAEKKRKIDSGKNK
eukprot:GHVP01005020.1.p1 GENE.GHVP01005020.1~~GHVP01005020.1.p1  ORF type:complete len:372 (-),score=82.40 GHVP01005020.1:35-1150(-)